MGDENEMDRARASWVITQVSGLGGGGYGANASISILVVNSGSGGDGWQSLECERFA